MVRVSPELSKPVTLAESTGATYQPEILPRIEIRAPSPIMKARPNMSETAFWLRDWGAPKRAVIAEAAPEPTVTARTEKKTTLGDMFDQLPDTAIFLIVKSNLPTLSPSPIRFTK